MSKHGYTVGEVVQFNGLTPGRFVVIDGPDADYVYGRWLTGPYAEQEDGFPPEWCERILPEIKEETVIEYNIAALDLAAEFNRSVEFSYQKEGSTNIERRTVSVESVVPTRFDEQLVVGYDEDRGEPRCFRVDRIQGDVVVF